jgi:phosphatidate cytidylyltransferase
MFFLIVHVVVSFIIIIAGRYNLYFAVTKQSIHDSLLYTAIELPLVFMAMLVASFFVKSIKLGNIITTAFLMFYPTALIVFLFSINHYTPVSDIYNNQYGLFGLALLFMSSCLSDTAAYLFGSAFGGPKLCPSISPKKTVSGALGGLIGGLFGVFLLYFIMKIPALGISADIRATEPYHLVVIGIAGSVFTQFGDLAASFIKRDVGIKDYGTIFPGHGGFMDRLDGLMFNAIFIYFYLVLFLG